MSTSKITAAQSFILTSAHLYPEAQPIQHKSWSELRFGSTDRRFLALGEKSVRVEVTLPQARIEALGIKADRIRQGGTSKLLGVLNASAEEMAKLLSAVAGKSAPASDTEVETDGDNASSYEE